MNRLPFIKKLAALSLLGGSLVSGAALAATCATVPNGELSLQGVLDGITVGGPSSVSAANDCISDGADSTWASSASGFSGTTMIVELAGNAGTNTFGVYDNANPGNFVQLLDGTATPGLIVGQALLTIAADGSVLRNGVDTTVDFAGNSFGFYLGTTQGNYFSDSSLNGGMDHMYAYQGTGDTVQLPGLAAGLWSQNEYILAWEDIYDGGDKDHNDMVLIVESVTPVPIPAAAWLFGSGLLGLAGIARRKKTT